MEKAIKTRLFMLISGVLSIVLITIALIVYMDILKPNLYGAEKAYNIGDYPKAISIYRELLNRNSKLVDAHLGLARSYEKTKQFSNSYTEYLNGISVSQNDVQKVMIMGQLIKFFNRNSMYSEYKDFIRQLNRKYSKNWVKTHLSLLSPTMLVLDDTARVDFTSYIYKLTSYFNKRKPDISFKNNKYDIAELAAISNVLSNVSPMENPYTMKRTKANRGVTPKTYQKKKYVVKSLDQVKADINDFLKIKTKKSFDELHYVEDPELPADPDIFIYQDHMFFLNSSHYPNYDILPSIDYVIDNFDGTYKITGTAYVKADEDSGINQWINSEYMETFPKYSNWQYTASFKPYYRFTVVVADPLKDSGAKFRLISIIKK